jgi:plastocyanin
LRKSTTVLFATFVAAQLASAPNAFGADNGEVEELRRELRSLQAQVQSLRTAISEAAELDRQRASILLKALKSGGGTTTSEAPPPPLPPSKAEPPPPPRVSEKSPARSEGRGRRVAPAAPAAPPPTEAAAGTIRGRVSVPGGEPVAYVYVENVMAPAVKGQKVTIEQVGKKFVPSWAVVQRGTTISFPNRDNIYHNVFSLSSGNSFDLGLYNSGSEAKTHTFSEPGAVDIYCNIHPQMAASALVVPNRHFAKVKGDGSFEIAGVPAGRRKVVGWSPSSRLTVEWVDLGPGQSADVNLKLEPKSPGHKNKAGQAYGQYD